MVLDPTAATVTHFNSTPGKVLAVSPDGKKVIVSDTADTPNQVFVFDTGANTSSAFLIAGATAADFSPDSLKAYIVAGSTLYVYSALEALKAISLDAPASDVSFLSEGAFAYLAGGSPSPLGVTVLRTCDNAKNVDTVTTPGTPTFIKTLGDATRVLTVDSPGIDLIDVNTTPQGCFPTVSDTINSFNLAQGDFDATQLILAPDSS